MDQKRVTLAAFEYPAEVQIVKTRLEADGIAVYLKDENTVGAEPFASQALGGVKLQVLEKDQEKAREIYDEIRAYARDEHEELIQCPNCGAKRSERHYSRKGLFYKLFPFFEPVKYRCLSCDMITPRK